MPKVLLVEDDGVLRYALERDLAFTGLNVVAVATSMAALDILEQPGHGFDVVLTDVVMPKHNPNGVALGRMLSAQRPRLAVIYMTGHPDVADKLNQSDPEIQVFRKPIDAGHMAAAILRAAGRQAHPDRRASNGAAC